MRSVLGFFSLLAIGVLASGVLFVAGTATLPHADLEDKVAPHIDLGSLLLGLVMGLVLSAMARVSWSEMPYRFASLLLRHERNIYRVILAILLIAVLVFY